MKAGSDLPGFCLPGSGQDALGAFQLVDEPDPYAGVGLYGGGTSTTLKITLASDRIVHLGFLLITVYAAAGQGRSASAPYRMVFSFVEIDYFADSCPYTADPAGPCLGWFQSITDGEAFARLSRAPEK